MKTFSYFVLLSVSFLLPSDGFSHFPSLTSSSRNVRTNSKYHRNSWMLQRRQLEADSGSGVDKDIKIEKDSDTHCADSLDSSSTFEILKEWINVRREEKATLLQYLSTWSKNYAGRGIGITSKELPSGISFSFDAFPTVAYKYEVDYIDDSGGGNLQVRGMWDACGDDSSLERNHDELVVRAVINLNSALSKDLNKLMVGDDAIEGLEMGKHRVDPTEVKDVERFYSGNNMQEVDPFERSNVDVQPVHEEAQRVPQFRRRDADLQEKAASMGLNLDKFENEGLAEQALEELNKMVANSRNSGYLGFLKQNASEIIGSDDSDTTALRQLFETGSTTSKDKSKELSGDEDVQLRLQEILSRKPIEVEEDLSRPPTKLPINLSAAGLEKGIDIFEGPPIYDSNGIAQASASSAERRARDDALDTSASYAHISAISPEEMKTDHKRFEMLVAALLRADEAMYDIILNSYRDLLLSGSLISLLKGMNETVSDDKTAKICAKIADKASELTQELAGLVRAESVRHLQTIHEICEISAKYQHDDVKFLEMMDTIRHKFDTALLSYLNFAIEEEESIIRCNGGDPARLPSTWLQVLMVVQRGIFAEFESRYERLLEPLILAVRFNDRVIQENVFKRFVNITAPLDLPYLRQLAINMVTNIENDIEGSQLQDGDIRKNVLALHDLIEKYLSDEYIKEKLELIRNNTESRGQKMRLANRNKDIQAINEALEEIVSTSQLPNDRGDIGNSIMDKTTYDIDTEGDSNEESEDKPQRLLHWG